MKKDLIALIEVIPKIETKFQKFEPTNGLCIPSGEFIYDDPEFITWKEEIKFDLEYYKCEWSYP